MASNKRYMVVGKWYGQRWADADFEVWESESHARHSLLVRDNMNWDSRTLLQEVSGSWGEFHTISHVENVRFYADSRETRRIDIYAVELEYDPRLMAWKFKVASDPWYRLTLGPRGGVRKEMY
jgi:hypothetical protein